MSADPSPATTAGLHGYERHVQQNQVLERIQLWALAFVQWNRPIQALPYDLRPHTDKQNL